MARKSNLALHHFRVDRLRREQHDEIFAPLDAPCDLGRPVGADRDIDVDEDFVPGGTQLRDQQLARVAHRPARGGDTRRRSVVRSLVARSLGFLPPWRLRHSLCRTSTPRTGSCSATSTDLQRLSSCICRSGRRGLWRPPRNRIPAALPDWVPISIVARNPRSTDGLPETIIPPVGKVARTQMESLRRAVPSRCAQARVSAVCRETVGSASGNR